MQRSDVDGTAATPAPGVPPAALCRRADAEVGAGPGQPEAHLRGAPEGRYDIEIIDLVASPQLARRDQIRAMPTLVRRLPEPIKRIIGDLSNTERVLVGLDLHVRE